MLKIELLSQWDNLMTWLRQLFAWVFHCASPDPDVQRRGRIVTWILIVMTLAALPDIWLVRSGTALFWVLGYCGSVGFVAFLNRRGAVALATLIVILAQTAAIAIGLYVEHSSLVGEIVIPMNLLLPLTIAAVALPLRWIPVVIIGEGFCSSLLFSWNPDPSSSLERASLISIAWGLFLLIGITLWIARIYLDRTLKDLRAANHQLALRNEERRLLLLALETIKEDQLRTIADDIHDNILSDFSALLYRIEAAEPERVPETRQMITEWAGDVQRLIAKLRNLIQGVRPRALGAGGLLDAVEGLVKRSENLYPTLQVTFLTRLPPQLDSSVETLLYRLIQESLLNVQKHASATQAKILLYFDDQGLYLRVEDDGVGFVPALTRSRALETSHIGLATLEERVTGVGGRFTVTSGVPGEGTQLYFEIPQGITKEV